MSSCVWSKIFWCFRKPEDKSEIDKIKTERHRFEKVTDMETLLKTIKKLSFFQNMVLKKLEINRDHYRLDMFDNVQRSVRRMSVLFPSMKKRALEQAQKLLTQEIMERNPVNSILPIDVTNMTSLQIEPNSSSNIPHQNSTNNHLPQGALMKEISQNTRKMSI